MPKLAPASRHRHPLPSYEDRLRNQVREKVLADFPADSHRTRPGVEPFQMHTDVWTIVAQAAQHTDPEPRLRHAVYVLECVRNTFPVQRGFDTIEKLPSPRYLDVRGADRLLYVGSTENVVRRLHEHLNDPGGAAAHFTSAFPPVRLLDLSFYLNSREARLAEKITAEEIRKEFPGDHVEQL